MVTMSAQVHRSYLMIHVNLWRCEVCLDAVEGFFQIQCLRTKLITEVVTYVVRTDGLFFFVVSH
jgi:hypothetical protein